MNLYFLVEGRRTESILYPEWFKYLLPSYSRMETLDSAPENAYYLVDGGGYPRLLDRQLPASIEDVNAYTSFGHLFVVLDSDDVPVEDRITEVMDSAAKATALRPHCELHVIVQARCIESWLLGNRKLYPQNPSDHLLRKFIQHYCVHENDPELSPSYSKYSTIAAFHEAYLQLIFRERALNYAKRNPGHAKDEAFLTALIDRTKSQPEHLQTFQHLLSILRTVRAKAGFADGL